MSLQIIEGAEPVPGYRLIRLLGQGGFGQVWEAMAPGGVRVALKFIRTDTGHAEPEQRAIEAIRDVRHPHLLEMHFSMLVEEYLIVATSLCDKNLWDRLCECQNGGQLGIPADELLQYMEETATALDFLNEPRHVDENGRQVSIQHRDIKPLNLFLVGDSIKVADFGLAKILATSVTGHTGSMTPHYAPPETFDGKVASTSDQYSLAVSYCQLRTGTLPFEGTPHEVLHAHVFMEPDLNALPAAEQSAVARALKKIPSERWPTCREFVAALKRPALVSAHQESAAPYVNVTKHYERPEEGSQSPMIGETDPGTGGVGRDTDPEPRRQPARRLVTSFVSVVVAIVMGALIYVATDYGTIRISLSDPSAVRHITLDGNEVVLRLLEQSLRLRAGEHSLNISSEGFEAVASTFTVKRGTNPDVEIEFTPTRSPQPPPEPNASVSKPTVQHRVTTPGSAARPTVLTVLVDPPMADVLITEGNGELTGNGSRRTLTVADPHTQETFRILAQLAGYHSIAGELHPAKDQTGTLKLKLAALPAVYDVKVTPWDANLRVDGVRARVVDFGEIRQVTIPFPCRVRPVALTATRDGYKSGTLELTPVQGDRQVHRLALTSERAVLTLSVEPADAQVTFDSAGVRQKQTGNKYTLTVDDPNSVDQIAIVTSLDGYEPDAFTWAAKPGTNDEHSVFAVTETRGPDSDP